LTRASFGQSLLPKRLSRLASLKLPHHHHFSTTVAIIAEESNPALKFIPDYEGVEFLVGNDAKTLASDPRTLDTEAFIYIVPGSVEALSAAWATAKKPKWVHSFYTGIDALSGFAGESLKEGEQTLTNAKGAYSPSLAEWVITSCLYFNKQIQRCQINREQKVWDKFVMNTLYGKTIGFVGFGHIAQTSAKLAKAFGMRVLALRKNNDKEAPYADVVFPLDSSLSMLSECEFVVCSLPNTPSTMNFLGEEEFNAMPSTSVLISIGRGTAIDEVALDQALEKKSIAGAALDVFREEPLDVLSPLWRHENLLLTAHNADFTDDYCMRGWDVWKANWEAYRAGKAFVTAVKTPSEGY